MRVARVTYPGALHHVMNRGRNKQNIFTTQHEFKYFESLLAKATSKFDTKVHCYCIMSNHFHLLVENVGGDMHQFMRWVCSRYAFVFNKEHGLDGPLFKDRYKSILIDSDQYLIAVVKYIHRNPLAFMPADRLHTYLNSSYPTYLTGISKPWLELGLVSSLIRDHSEYVSSMESNELYEFDSTQLKMDLSQYLSYQDGVPEVRGSCLESLIFLAVPENFMFDHLTDRARLRKEQKSTKLLNGKYDHMEVEVLLRSVTNWFKQNSSTSWYRP